MGISTIDNWVNKHGISLDHIRNPQEMSYAYPKTIDDIEYLFSEYIFKLPRRSSNRLYLAQLQDFYVFSNGGMIDKTLQFQIEGFPKVNGNPSSNITLNNAVSLVSQWGSTNYWHWMSESLARISLLGCVPDDTVYIVNSLRNNFVVDSLKMVGIDPQKCIEIDNVKSVFAKHLYLPSKMGDFDKKGLLFLREKIKSIVIPLHDSPKKIFISRKISRRVENESEVMVELKKRGFTLIQCEKITFENQVKIFYNVEVIVAPHGAGLTNLLFAKDNAKVLELRSPNYFGRTYYYLSNHLGFDYYSLYGTGELPKTSEQISCDLQANMTIDILRLQKTLDWMGV